MTRDDPEMRDALRRSAADAVAPSALTLAGLYAFFTISHTIFLPRDVGRIMVPFTAIEAAVCVAMCYPLTRRAVDPKWGHALVAFIGLLALANSLTLVFLLGEAKQTTNLYFLAIGGGFLLVELPWFAAYVGLVIVGFTLALLRVTDKDWTHFAFGMLSAVALAVLVHVVRVRTLKAAVRMRREAVQLERLQEQNDFKNAFINNTAHELGTPLTPIKIQLSLLEQANDAESRARSLGVLKRNFHRLERIIEDLLTTTRLQGSKLTLARSTFDLARALRETAETFAPGAARGGVAIDVEAPAELHIDGDGAKIHQVLDNLVANAVKFTPSGGRVALRARLDGDEALVSVTDTGAGIAREDLAKLFQPFSQLKAGRERGGTGLGLHISRAIVELHGGRIWVESAGEGKGSTFAFALPVDDDA